MDPLLILELYMLSVVEHCGMLRSANQCQLLGSFLPTHSHTSVFCVVRASPNCWHVHVRMYVQCSPLFVGLKFAANLDSFYGMHVVLYAQDFGIPPSPPQFGFVSLNLSLGICPLVSELLRQTLLHDVTFLYLN